MKLNRLIRSYLFYTKEAVMSLLKTLRLWISLPFLFIGGFIVVIGLSLAGYGSVKEVLTEMGYLNNKEKHV